MRTITAMLIAYAAAGLLSAHQPVPCPGPLSEAQLTALRKGQAPKKLQVIVQTRGVGFALSDPWKSRLRAARVSADLLEETGARGPQKATIAARTEKVNSKDGLAYVWIPPGSFMMGCSPGDTECSPDERPAHEVAITKGFWLGRTPVTQGAYQRVTGSNPSNSKGDQRPVEQVTWDKARSYCQAIGGRLPTEAEWEYAARADSTGTRYGSLAEIAWYAKNSGGRTHQVGQKKPNAFGLYDMLGNVWQWTADWYGATYYQAGERRDPTGPPGGEARTLRGGSWGSYPMYVRVSARYWPDQRMRDWDFGLRCVGE